MEDITGLFRYDEIAALESAFSLDETLEQKYGTSARDYVVRDGGTQRVTR
jgi:hypothetical protein